MIQQSSRKTWFRMSPYLLCKKTHQGRVITNFSQPLTSRESGTGAPELGRFSLSLSAREKPDLGFWKERKVG